MSDQQPTAIELPIGRRRSSYRRRLLGVAGGVAALAAIGSALLGAGPANAAVNQSGPHTTYTWGSCTIWVGDRPVGYAEGDVQSSCSTRHTIASVVYLYRNGVLVESSNALTWSNAYASDNWTAGYSLGGKASWQTIAYVSMDGGAYYTLTGPVASYSPTR